MIFKNARSNGALAAAGGIVNKDYPFHWTRDAALVYDAMFREALDPQSAVADRQAILDRVLRYMEFTKQNQSTWTPKIDASGNMLKDQSGNLVREINFGEPKFELDGRSFDQPWGRPQNDGPALRSLTLLRLARSLGKGGEATQSWAKALVPDAQSVLRKLYDPALPGGSIIKDDLEFVAHHWQDPSFDLWEEVMGDHFYTRLVQKASLEQGAQFAKAAGDPGAARFYQQQAKAIDASLDGFWDPTQKRILATRNFVRGHTEKVSGLDSSVLLGVLHTEGSFAIDDERLLSTVAQLEDDFRARYPVNHGSSGALLVGRYPEDLYYGGNPWVLITQGYAEFYLRLAKSFKKSGTIEITSTNIDFFQKLNLSPTIQALVQPGAQFASKDPAYAEILAILNKKGNEFVELVQKHSPMGVSSSSEQLSRTTGVATGAENLSWNAASFLRLRSALKP